MGKPNRLKELEAERGDLHKVIPQMVNLHGQAYAAAQLKTSVATINKWLKTNGYQLIQRYENKTRKTHVQKGNLS